MRLAELTRRSGVPRSTIKFYIREGLLPAGDPQGRNQATLRPAPPRAARADPRAARGGGPAARRDHARRAAARPGARAGLGRGGRPGRRGAARDLRAARSASSAARSAPSSTTLRAEVREFVRRLPWTTDDEAHYFVDEIADALLQVRRYLYPDFPGRRARPLRARGVAALRARVRRGARRRARARARARRRHRRAHASRDPVHRSLRPHLRRAAPLRERDALDPDRRGPRGAAGGVRLSTQQPGYELLADAGAAAAELTTDEQRGVAPAAAAGTSCASSAHALAVDVAHHRLVEARAGRPSACPSRRGTRSASSVAKCMKKRWLKGTRPRLAHARARAGCARPRAAPRGWRGSRLDRAPTAQERQQRQPGSPRGGAGSGRPRRAGRRR